MENEIRRPLSHVRSALVFPIFRYALAMVVLGFAVGIFSREFTRAYLRDIPLATQWLAGHYLGQVHGHILILGSLLPSVLGLITYALRGEMTPEDVGHLQALFTIIIASSLVTLVLQLYRGVTMVSMIGGNPALSSDQVDARLFFGNTALRTGLYTLAHTALGVSTTWFVLKLRAILRTLGQVHVRRAP